MKKIVVFVFGLLFIVSNVFLISGCGKGDNGGEYTPQTDDIMLQFFDSNMPESTVEFTSSIMKFEDFERIIPLGNINPPGHTFPTDHIYFVLIGNGKPVYAPCGGKVLFIEEANSHQDRAIRVAVTSTVTYYLGHVFVSENLKVGDMVSSGAEIAISGNTNCVDFGVINKNINNAFISDKMPLTTKYGDKPLKYYTESLRIELYAKVKAPNPNPADYPDFVYNGNVTDGEFAIDKLGSLRGNWIEEGKMESGWYDWVATLSFAYDVYYRDQIRIASGKYNYAFALKNEDNSLKPEDVSTSSGAVAYYLYNANNTPFGAPTGSRYGLMTVQMLSDTRIRLEIFEDTTSQSREFTSALLYYVR